MSIVALLLPFIILLSVALLYVVIRNRRNHLKHKKEIFSNELYLRKIIQSYNKDEMETEPTNVELHELIGEGAFGIVRKGVLKPSNMQIAVKMLKGIDDCTLYHSKKELQFFADTFFRRLCRECKH